MATIRTTGEKIDPEFTEEDFISGLETFINRCIYPTKGVEISRVSQGSERGLGYDGILTSLVPFYIQFKRSYFLTPKFNGKINKDRGSSGLAVDRGVFAFDLHIDKSTGEFLQHNTLYKLSQNSRKKAVYIAPLFFRKTHLSELKFHQARSPWYYDDLEVYDGVIPTGVIPFQNVRLFHQCITIPPHRIINDKLTGHSYSFTQNGQVCFHSDPEVIRGYEFQDLNQFINSILGSSPVTNLDEYSDRLIDGIPEWFGLSSKSKIFKFIINYSLNQLISRPNPEKFTLSKIKDSLSAYEKMLLIENILAEHFGIVQFIKRERII